MGRSWGHSGLMAGLSVIFGNDGGYNSPPTSWDKFHTIEFEGHLATVGVHFLSLFFKCVINLI